MLVVLALPITVQGQSTTTVGRDFWVAFVVNGGDQRPQQTELNVICENNCSMTVTNPLTGWSSNISLNSGSPNVISIPITQSVPEHYAMTETKGLHVTATDDIQLTAVFTQLASTGMTGIFPTEALDTRYIVLDYPADPGRTSNTGAIVTILATQDNTTISYTPPCSLYTLPGDPAAPPAGVATSHTFTHAGQTLTLMANSANATLSGMQITSNKPIAVFQGNQITGVPYNTSSGDMLYDQALPVGQWGKRYALVPTQGRSVGDRVRVVTDSACTVTLSTGSSFMLSARGVHEFDLPATSPCILTADKPVCVGLCTKGSDWNAEPGDGSLLIMPPTTRGINRSRFATYSTQRIDTWYVAVVTDQPSTMTLDGTSIASQFHAIGATGSSYARINVTSGVHTLNNSSGTFTAWTYGVGNVESYVYSLGHALELPPVCPDHTHKGRDFWMTYIPIDPQCDLRLTLAADTATNVTITGPDSTITFSLAAGGSITRIVGQNSQINTYNTPFNGSFHITANHDIWVYANNDFSGTSQSTESATILPTFALDTAYIAQDYPPYAAGHTVSFVATENNTVLSMTLPCPIQGTTLTTGNPLTITLQQGQAYHMSSSSATTGFSGMRVASNGKPFAMYHGGISTRVPVNAVDGGDLTYEQALPMRDWGTDFVAPGFSFQGGDSHVRITASEANTHISINGTPIASTLNAGQCYEHSLPYTSNCRITSDKPVCVILYMSSYREGGNNGDPASVTLPPLDRGVCKTMFRVDNFGNMYSHYLTVICPTAINGSVQLDGAYLSTGATLCDEYTVYRLPISQGHHSLESSGGPFVAFAYGYGPWKGYAYPLTFNLDTIVVEPEHQLHHDTITYYDSVCSGQSYISPMEIVCGGTSYFPPSGLIYIPSSGTAEAGILERWSNWVVDDTVHHLHLVLTVLPTYITTLQLSLIPGDTLFFLDDTLTEACNRTYPLQSVYGCDSLVDLYVNYADVILSSNSQGGCPGEEVTLTAEGTHIFNWSSSPYDPELDSQQGQNPVTVHPQVTTTYHLLDASGLTIASVTVGVEPPPTLCVETNRDFIDFDHPVLTLHDCSPDRYSSSWVFSDGYILNGERARRQFQYPLPDTVTVTLHSCNQYNCCVDTTLGFRPEIRSVWFPNIFTPDLPQNNRFGAVTSCQVADFEIFVYNRQGLLVWHSTDIQTPWDGTHDGTPVPQGAYAYRWYLKDLHGDRWSGTGTVTLLR